MDRVGQRDRRLSLTSLRPQTKIDAKDRPFAGMTRQQLRHAAVPGE